MPLHKYNSIVGEINEGIESFNQLLATEFRLPSISPLDAKTYSVIANIHWDDQVWPRNDCAGVYILCGFREAAPSELGVYIGKSSLGNIGTRIWSWLDPHRAAGIYRKDDKSGEPYVLEAIATVALDDARLRPFASALEEYIIAAVRDSVHLLNKTGNPN